ncbi:ribosome maturation factor RimM [Litoribacillus peritrichatus]|uniref:Ribosome maturation factor RimM n=1 Tax=Litoribacillus peritrichatus TaxID=718191 RepID=A0ABP7MI90_9GAMM
MASSSDKTVTLGKITGVFGVKGWVKVYSYTEPMEGIFDYQPWYLDSNGKKITVEVEKCQRHGKGMIAKLAKCDDRDQAATFSGSLIKVTGDELPELDDGDYYWHQLENLKVISVAVEGEPVLLGKVAYLTETGSNDILVVKSCSGSIDKQERLVPYLPDLYVLNVDLEEQTITVDWDPEF